jgi:integrase
MARGDGRMFQRGERWFIAYYAPDPARPGHGKEHKESFETEKKARAVLKARIREKGAAKLGLTRFKGPEMERLLVNEILDAYLGRAEVLGRKSLRQIRSHVKPIRTRFGTMRCLAVTPESITSYIEERKAEGFAAASINRQLETLSAAYRLAIKDGRLTYMPRIDSLAEHNVERGFFEAEELDGLLPHLPEHIADLCRFAAVTGWRRADLVGLRWEWVNLAEGVIRLPEGTTKEGSARTLHLGASLRALLDRRYSARLTEHGVCDLVFHKDGRPVGDIRKAWASACRKAGIQPRSKLRKGKQIVVAGRKLHDFRRTATRNLSRAGVGETVVRSITGHKTSSMFHRYSITTGEDQRAALEALARREGA